MILLNVLEGNVIAKEGIKLNGNLATGSRMLIQGNVINGGAKSLPAYTGSYTVTPSQTEQILLTDEMRMTGNITVEPIPSNYGLITWNGSFLTVS